MGNILRRGQLCFECYQSREHHGLAGVGCADGNNFLPSPLKKFLDPPWVGEVGLGGLLTVFC